MLGTVPFVFRRTYLGVLLWNWLAFMNPHQYTWSFARNFRFSLLVAVVTLVAFFAQQQFRRIPWRAPVIFTVALLLWISFTTFFVALNPSGAWEEWDRFLRVILMVLVALAVLDTRTKLDWLVWVIALSVGFYGFKGGLFTIAHGGAYRVGGPPFSFIAGNNEIAFALVVCLPLMRYLQLQAQNRWIRLALTVVMVLCAFSIVGSHSRGAFLAGGVMAFTLWLRSRRKLLLGAALALTIPFLFSFMPEHWHDRMATIQTYEEDTSALGRINAWYFAWNLAKDYPVTGGGARVFTPALFQRYAPEPDRVHDAHSIYFEMLGEQGFVGLGLFLAVGISTLFYGSRLMRLGRSRESLRWAYDLGSMSQVCIIGYAAGGAFLGLAYWDLPYTVTVMVVVGREIAERQLWEEMQAEESVQASELEARSA